MVLPHNGVGPEQAPTVTGTSVMYGTNRARGDFQEFQKTNFKDFQI